VSTDQVWLITGTSRGFGRSLAEAVLGAGHRRSPRRIDSLTDLVERYGHQVRTTPLERQRPSRGQASC
jgi:NAD(P)-dependent dehydrogenase (short-subunit alcohol dehydrogenase family)